MNYMPVHDFVCACRYQNTYKQTLCVEMLQQGFHRSFCEIFGLIKQQADVRLSAGPDSNLWNQKPLTEEHDKLETMKRHLIEAEKAILLGIKFKCHSFRLNHGFKANCLVS
jgi:hypothetical protein